MCRFFVYIISTRSQYLVNIVYGTVFVYVYRLLVLSQILSVFSSGYLASAFACYSDLAVSDSNPTRELFFENLPYGTTPFVFRNSCKYVIFNNDKRCALFVVRNVVFSLLRFHCCACSLPRSVHLGRRVFCVGCLCAFRFGGRLHLLRQRLPQLVHAVVGDRSCPRFDLVIYRLRLTSRCGVFFCVGEKRIIGDLVLHKILRPVKHRRRRTGDSSRKSGKPHLSKRVKERLPLRLIVRVTFLLISGNSQSEVGTLRHGGSVRYDVRDLRERFLARLNAGLRRSTPQPFCNRVRA